MTTALQTVTGFYAALSQGDIAAALGAMAPDIEWVSMWPYRAAGPGPDQVAAGVFAQLQLEWRQFAIIPSEYVVEGESVLSVGRFTGVHGTTGKSVDAAYAHLWTVRDGRITRFRQYIDTLAVDTARH